MLKNKINSIKVLFCLSVFVLMITLFYCDLVDPTEVKNPQITEESLSANPNGGTTPLITGLKFAFADAVRMTVLATEVVSDDYDNTYTYVSPDLDFPQNITPDDQHINSTAFIYFKIQNLRALADFGIETIIPKDIMATNNQKGEVYFYHGTAYLLLAENFWAFPVKENGSAITAANAIKIAIDDFKKALTLTTDNTVITNCTYALARTYRLNGDKTNAEIQAKAALALNPDYLFQAEYDPTSLSNYVDAFVVTRGNNDYQPLPRLDFLDPKYTGDGDPIAFLKAEEPNLILAEVAVANGDLTTAKTYMKTAVSVAKARETTTYTDRDTRKNRPNDPSYSVKASASAEAVMGLIQKRSGSTVTIYSVSNTSLTESKIDALTTQNQIVRALYLLRQEIFFLEGRRMSDLGIRLPVMRREMDANKNITAGSPGTTVVVPGFIPAGDGMDKFTIDAATKTVTITYDGNQIIADNYNLIRPFK
jgi:hypothetical protein